VEREELLHALRPAAALVGEHPQRLADFRQARVVPRPGGAGAAADAVEDRRQVEQPGARVKEVRIQGLVRGERRHGDSGLAYSRLLSRLTSAFRLPERKPSRSSVTKAKPNSLKRRSSASRTSGSASCAIPSVGTSIRATSPSCSRTRHSRKPSACRYSSA